MSAIFWKELADHFGRRRFILTLSLILFGVLWGLFILQREVNGSGSAQGELLFLRLFTASSGVLPPVLFYIGFFGPLVGIALGFDSVNSERSQGTLARLLAQPIHRDAVFNGKFLAGLLTLAIVLVSMVLSIVGLGMFVMGYAPGSEEVVRLLGFSVVATVYLAFWLALAMTLSIFFRNTVASALVALGVWLFTSFFVALLIAPAAADLIVPNIESVEEAVRHFNVSLWVARVSPSTLFDEATQTLLSPNVRTLGPLLQEQTQGLLSNPISAGQSLQLVWPHIVVVFSMVAFLVSLSYVKFLREEIRS